MADYKRAFEILMKKFDISYGKETIEFAEKNSFGHNTCITEEEYNCVKDCIKEYFKVEFDSMEKIIEEFKELGYECEQYNNCIEFTEWDKADTAINEITIYKDGRLSCDLENDYLYDDQLQLINRVLRLWGTEV